MVSSADIARLGGVGRAAVSNWRRRYGDFPAPVAGTASSPLFSLQAVQSWLTTNGKAVRVPLAEQAWQRLRAAAGEHDLGETLARAGAFLLAECLGGHPPLPDPIRPELPDRALGTMLTELAEEQGVAEAFELLCERFRATHVRTTSPETVRLMAGLLGERPGTVLDPASGIGTLLLAAHPERALVQDTDPSAAAITAVRLWLAGVPAEVHASDSLRANNFAERSADAVLCDPPFNERSWGHAELAEDPRWTYGQPPRGEPELAWAQHCLAAVRPGGTVVLHMPKAVAGRRSGRRIRANLLRAGAVRAVYSLPEGHDVWCLRRPLPEQQPPHTVLLAECRGLEPEPLTEHGQRVPIEEILDDAVDLNPARQRLSRERADVGAEFEKTRESFRAGANSINSHAARMLGALREPRTLPGTTLAELTKSGALAMLTPQPGTADLPVLTTADLAADRQPSGGAGLAPERAIRVRAGDVIASAGGLARVACEEMLLGHQLTAYRTDPNALDAEFLAGVLRATGARGTSKLDPRRVRIPELSLSQQHEYATAFAELDALRAAARELAENADSLAELGFLGLLDGQISPSE